MTYQTLAQQLFPQIPTQRTGIIDLKAMAIQYGVTDHTTIRLAAVALEKCYPENFIYLPLAAGVRLLVK